MNPILASRGVSRDKSCLRDERGAVLVIMAFALVVFLGIAALAIDLGLLFVARSEAQRAADAAAHAGAGYFLVAPNDGAGAREAAVSMAAANTVRGTAVTLDPAIDIDVDMSGNRRLVRVRVLRTEGSGGGIPTLFARILGVPEVGVSASAAAEVFTVGESQCIMPIAIPDRFCTDWDGVACSSLSGFGDGPGDVQRYIPWIQNPGAPPAEWVFNANATGFSAADRGLAFTLVPGVGGGPPGGPPGQGGGPPGQGGGPPGQGGGPPGQGGGPPGQGGGSAGGGGGFGITSWWNVTVRRDQGNVGNQSVQAIFNCDVGAGLGDEMTVAPGARESLRIFFDSIVGEDQTAVWNPAADGGRGCVTTDGSDVCRSSPRIRPIVLYDPTLGPTGPANSSPPFQVANLLGVFVEELAGSEVTARIVEFSQVTDAATPGLVPGTFGRMIRIVE